MNDSKVLVDSTWADQRHNRTKVLIEARKIVENGWCKFAGAKDYNCEVVSVESKNARTYCVLGALDRACASVYKNYDAQLISYLTNNFMEYFGKANDIENVISWNDDWDRDVKDVLTAFDAAIHKSRWDQTCHKNTKIASIFV